jgi:catechol 2,3-dioxygenase-like lactoylglutathione lyase family enzyme
VPRLATVTLVVADYDEAVAFFVERVGFELVEDTSLADGKRWVVVASRGGEQRAVIGRQTGGRVGFFLEERRTGRYGTVVVFEDLYGKRWDLLEPGLALPDPGH